MWHIGLQYYQDYIKDDPVAQLQARCFKVLRFSNTISLNEEREQMHIQEYTRLIFVRGSTSVGDYDKIPCHHNYYTKKTYCPHLHL